MSALFNLYGQIATAITDNVPEIKHVDIDIGQLKKEGAEIPVIYPAVLIRIENVYWKDYDAAKQIGVVHLRLKIIYPFENETEYYSAPHGVRTEMATFYAIVENVNRYVSLIAPGTFTRINRFNEAHLETNPEEQKWIYCLDYYCNVYSDGSDFIDGESFDFDYDLLLKFDALLDRTLRGKKVG